MLASVSLLCFQLTAQAQLGQRLDAFAGINGVFLQPAANVSTPYDWDLNLANVGIAFSNNYAFLSNASGFGLLRDARQNLTADVLEDDQAWALGDQTYAYDFLNRGEKHFGNFELDVLGPAFSIQVGDWTRIGAFSRFRTSVGARGIDANFSYYPYDQRANGSSFVLDQTTAAMASWAEVGLHLSQAIPVGDEAELQLGLNARYLIPFEGGYFSNPGGTEFTKFGVDTIGLRSGVTQFAFSGGVRDADNISTPSGNGFGFDIGLRYAWEPLKQGGYRYTLGLSVIDAGIMTFNQNAELHQLSSENVVAITSQDYRFVEGQDDVDEVIGILNEQFYGRRDVSLIDDQFTIGLPTALSIQFSYQPINDLKLSTAYVGGLNLDERQLKTGQQVALAAHYSRWWYGAGLTTNLHDWRYLNLGFQLRLGPVTLGTDRFVGTISKAKRFQAADFYVGVKFHNFGLKKTDQRALQFKRARSSRRVKCYEW